MALVNSKYVADILNLESDESDENKYKTLVDLYEEELDKNKINNLLYAFIILAIIYPIIFFTPDK